MTKQLITKHAIKVRKICFKYQTHFLSHRHSNLTYLKGSTADFIATTISCFNKIKTRS